MLNSTPIVDALFNQGYSISDQFLEQADYLALCHMARDLDTQGLFRKAKIGLSQDSQHNEAIRTDAILWLDEEPDNHALDTYLKHTRMLADQINQSLFLGLIEFEAHFASYKTGTFYKKHIDQFAKQKNRKISCVYYLNEHWQADFGGNLLLYSKEDQLLQEVRPLGNRFICFNSELPHEVTLTQQARYSIAGWMKTRPY